MFAIMEMPIKSVRGTSPRTTQQPAICTVLMLER